MIMATADVIELHTEPTGASLHAWGVRLLAPIHTTGSKKFPHYCTWWRCPTGPNTSRFVWFQDTAYTCKARVSMMKMVHDVGSTSRDNADIGTQLNCDQLWMVVTAIP